MKKIVEMFPEFHQEKLETTDLKAGNSLIVVDTNFLLQILELPIEIATKYIEALKNVKNNLYIPYLVALEFHFNKSTKKKSKRRNAKEYYEKVNSAMENLKQSLKTIDSLKIDTENNKLEKLSQELSNFSTNFLKKVDDFIKDEITNKEDVVYRDLLDIISDSVGEIYEQNWIDEIEKEGEKRFDNNIPPGYDDRNKNGIRKYNGISYQQKYGDLIIWKDILKKSKEETKRDKVIFITNDGESNKKSDLLYTTSNMKVGPNIYLMNELYMCSRKKLYILNNIRFVNMVSDLSNDEIDRIEKMYVVHIPEQHLDEAKKLVREKNTLNNSSKIFYIDSENRLARIDTDKIEPFELMALLDDSDVEEMLREELSKKIFKKYYARSLKNLNKDYEKIFFNKYIHGIDDSDED